MSDRMPPEEFKKQMDNHPYKPAEIFKGENVEVHPTAVLGESGFSWLRGQDGEYVHIPNLGDIWLSDNVKIGELASIKRATRPGYVTKIGKGSVVRNHASVGHNCWVKENCWIGPNVTLNGSVVVENGVWIGSNSVIKQGITIGENAVVGIGSVVVRDVPPDETVIGNPAKNIVFHENTVHPSFKYGKGLEIGKYNHIHADVEVGNNCKIRSFTEIRSGTVLGNDVYVDSGVKSSGDNKVGDRVILRYDSILAKGCIVESDVFISPQLMTENLNHRGEPVGGAHIGEAGDYTGEYRVFIGTNVTLAAGITICNGVIIGSKANVRKSITEPGIWLGNPAKLYRRT